MSRKQTIWIVMPMLLSLVLLSGCPKKKPVTRPTDLNVDTTTVSPPPAGPTTDVKPPQAPAPTADQTEDPLLSQDLQVVNDELRRRGFSPDIYFDYDQSALTDDSRGKLSRNADLLKAQSRLSMTIEGHCDERGTSEYNLASANAAPTPPRATCLRSASAPTACAP